MPFIGHFLWKTFNFDLFYGKRMKNSQQIGRKSTYFSKKCIISLISVNNSMFIVSKSAFSHPKTYNKHVIWYFDSHMRSKDSIEKNPSFCPLTSPSHIPSFITNFWNAKLETNRSFAPNAKSSFKSMTTCR